MAKPENPPAFPTDGRIQHGTPYDGMSLRDWFAGQALAATVHENGSHETHASINAEESYAIADAMLTARAKGGDDAG